MSGQERPLKFSKQLRQKAQEYLSNIGKLEILSELAQHFENGAEQHSYLLTLEMIFTNLLKEKQMYIEVTPLKPVDNTPENEFKQLLRNIYEDCYMKILRCIENQSQKIQTQGL